MKKDGVVLRLDGVDRTYTQAGQAVMALQKTTFSIRSGEFVAIIGPSGSGKSTFLTIAGGLQRPSSGTVTIDGTDITKLSIKELSKVRLSKVGFVLQASNLVPYLTVDKQLSLIDRITKRKRQDEVVRKLYDELSISTLSNKYPSDLSGGERQRVAIAKVLYGTSKLILADEPTASLDTVRAFEVVKLLSHETHQHGKATIMVTHDDRLLKYCDSVYEMRDGRIRKAR